MWDPFDRRVFESAAARRQATAMGLGIVVGTAVVGIVVRVYAPWVTDPTAVREVIARFGIWSPVVFVAVQAVQVVVAPVPGQLLGAVGGYLFGWVRGTAYSMIGVVVGSYVVIRAARTYGRPAVERWIDDGVRERFDDFVQRNGVPALFVIYLLPTSPDDAVCALAGLTRIRIRTLIALVVLGRFPSFLAVAYAGTQLAEADHLALAGVLGTIGIVTAAAYRWRDLVRRRIERVADGTE